jgi:hypothetical protein
MRRDNALKRAADQAAEKDTSATIGMYVCIYIYICIYVCMCVFIYSNMYIWINK